MRDIIEPFFQNGSVPSHGVKDTTLSSVAEHERALCGLRLESLSPRVARLGSVREQRLNWPRKPKRFAIVGLTSTRRGQIPHLLSSSGRSLIPTSSSTRLTIRSRSVCVVSPTGWPRGGSSGALPSKYQFLGLATREAFSERKPSRLS